MRSLTEIKGVGDNLAASLTADGWDVQRLALASPGDLTGYPGLGRKKAAQVIADARRLVNEALAYESGQMERRPDPASQQGQPAAGQQTGGGVFDERTLRWKVPPYPMSVRVRRIWKRDSEG